MTRLVTVACWLVCGLDIVQLWVRPWEAARLGAVVGAVLYAVAAILLSRGQPAGTWMARLIPAIPTTLILGSAVVGTVPDPWMVGIYGVQLVAAFDAWGPMQARPAA